MGYKMGKNIISIKLGIDQINYNISEGIPNKIFNEY